MSLKDFTKKIQFVANLGISGGRIEVSIFVFFVKWLNIYENLGDAGGSDQIVNF